MQPAADAAAGPVPAPRSLTRRTELLGGGLLAAILVVAAVTYTRSNGSAPTFDEAGYTATLDAIRHGQEIGSQVYLVQPPGFYFLLEWIGGTIGSSLHDLRIGMLLVALVALGAAYAIGRRYGGVAGGLGAAGLLAVAPPFPVNAARVEADPPSIALGLVALALAVWSYGPARERSERPWLAAAAGVALACSILVKLFTGTIFVPLVALAIRNRTSWRTLAATVAGGLGTLPSSRSPMSTPSTTSGVARCPGSSRTAISWRRPTGTTSSAPTTSSTSARPLRTSPPRES